MSTILDALRKAQEDTGGKQQPPVGEHPVANEAVAPAPRRRRRVGWPVAVLAILAVAFAGGLALGDRIVALFGGSGDAPPPAQEARLAARDEPASPADPADVKQQAAAPAASPVTRRGRRAAQGADDAPPPRFAQTADSVAAGAAGAGERKTAPGRPESPDAAPTPYGRLHVFGAGEQPSSGKQTEDRLARLQQLREKMLKARQEAGARDAQHDAAPPTQIFVPPPRDAAAPQNAGAKAAAPASDVKPEGAATRDAATEADGAPVEVAHVAPAPAAAAPAAPPTAEPAAAAVGVSVSSAHADGAEMHDPDIPPPAPAEAAPAAAPEPPVTVASVPPPEPAPAAGARSASPTAGTMQVLRRAPGGAPQVAINILQWSAEPGRRFAFVSVDGGNMTQVREGDRIGGLTVKHIHQQMIEFGFNDSTFLLRAN